MKEGIIIPDTDGLFAFIRDHTSAVISKTEKISDSDFYRLFEMKYNGQNAIVRVVHQLSRELIEQLKLQIEILSLLNSHNLPAPRLLESHIGEPYNYIILQKIKGSSLNTLWNRLDHHARVSFAAGLGQAMNNLHDVSVTSLISDKQISWGQPLLESIWSYIDMIEDQEYYGTVFFEKMRSLVKKYGNEIPEQVIPAIIHNDLNSENLLLVRTGDNHPYHLNGIIDWEWSFIGHRHYDLINLGSLLYNNHDLLSSFYEGYGFSPGASWWRLRRIYLLHKYLHSAMYDIKANTFNQERRRLTYMVIRALLN